MHEYRPPEQFATYQQGYQSLNETADVHDHRPDQQVVDGQREISYSQNIYQGHTTSAALFSTPLPHNDVRFVAVLTYTLGWFSGLLFVLFARESRYVRFHALQSLIFFGAINVLDVALLYVGMILHSAGRYGGILHISSLTLFLGICLLNVIAFVGWLVAIVQAYRGSYYRLPLAGDFVARSLNKPSALK